MTHHRSAVSDVAALAAEVDRLRGVCAEAYQAAGAAGAPARVLDNLWAAAEGQPLPHASILPVLSEEYRPLPPAWAPEPDADPDR